MEKNSFETLPLNCCIHVLYFLKVHDIMNFCLTSKKHSNLISNEKLFYKLCERDIEVLAKKNESWKKYYIENLKFEFDAKNTTPNAIISKNKMNTEGEYKWLISSSKVNYKTPKKKNIFSINQVICDYTK